MGLDKIFRLSLVCVSFLFAVTHVLHAQCSLSQPVASGGCTFGPGQVSLSVSGSSGYYLWYTLPSGGIPVAAGSSYSPFLSDSSRTYYVAATDTNTALSFDGTNDYIALNYNFNSSGALSTFTAEGWVKTTVSGVGSNDNWAILDFDRSEYFNLFVRGDNGQVGFSTTNTGGTIDDFYSSGVSVNDGNWHHVAGVYDGTDKIIYVDGVEVARKTNPHSGGNIGTGTNRFGIIGDGSEAGSFNASRNNFYFQGDLDEVRLWNTVRTPSQINTYKDSTLDAIPTGLVLYYPMNEVSGSSIVNAVGGGGNGTLYNFASSAWVSGCPVFSDCESSRDTITAQLASGGMRDTLLSCSNSTVTLDAGMSTGTFSWNTGASSQTITASRAGIYSVTVTGGSCPGNRTISVVGKQNALTSVVFDGTNDYGAIEDLMYSGGGYEEMTVETWLKTSNSGDQVIASFDRSEYWRLEINGDGGGNGQIGFDVHTSSGTEDFGSTTRVDDGEWHHVAAVFDNGVMRIYIDGILDDTTNTGATFGSSTTRYGFLGVGSEADSYNGSTGPNSWFDGELDEFRVWSTARTQTQIRENMLRNLPPNQPGLEVYYKFDQPSGNNLKDYATADIYNVNMINTAAGSRVKSGVPLGDESTYLFPTSWSGQSITLTTCNGESLTLSNMSGSVDGAFVYYVNTSPSSTTGISGAGGNNRYFGVHKINGGSSTYLATYNYTGNTIVDNTTEPDLELFIRSSPDQTSWSTSTASLDTSANTLQTTASSTEFVLGSGGFPLPVELLSFEAVPNLEEEVVNLFWVTSSEINNNYFTVERTKDLVEFDEVLTVAGMGTTNQRSEYRETDYSPFTGVSYYRLSQTDFDGKREFFNVEEVSFDKTLEVDVELYPNPNNGHNMFMKIPITSPDELKVLVNDFIGKEYFLDFSVVDRGDHLLIVMEMSNKLKPGSYLVNVQTPSGVLTHKLIVR